MINKLLIPKGSEQNKRIIKLTKRFNKIQNEINILDEQEKGLR